MNFSSRRGNPHEIITNIQKFIKVSTDDYEESKNIRYFSDKSIEYSIFIPHSAEKIEVVDKVKDFERSDHICLSDNVNVTKGGVIYVAKNHYIGRHL